MLVAVEDESTRFTIQFKAGASVFGRRFSKNSIDARSPRIVVASIEDVKSSRQRFSAFAEAFKHESHTYLAFIRDRHAGSHRTASAFNLSRTASCLIADLCWYESRQSAQFDSLTSSIP